MSVKSHQNGKGDKPRSGYNKDYRESYDKIFKSKSNEKRKKRIMVGM